MKNILHVLAIVFAAGLPCTFAAGFVGVALPAALGAGNLLLGFSCVLGLQLLFHDYASVAPSLAARMSTRVVSPVEKTPLRLAA